MGEVVELPVATLLDLPAERILKRAVEADLRIVIVIGRDQDGELYLAPTTSNLGSLLVLLERAKEAFLASVDP